MEQGAPDERLVRELAPGERILWSGRPRQGWVLRRADLFLVPFSLFWCGFIVLWEVLAFRQMAHAAFKFFGIPFVLVGLYLLLGRFLVDALQRRRTLYAVTSSRILILSGILSPTVESLPLHGLARVTLSEGSDGRGDIVFGAPSPIGAFALPGWPGMRQFLPPVLEGIPAAREVHDFILRAQQDGATGPAGR